MTLELDTDADPIHGSLSDELGSQLFDGWVELVRVIEDALARARMEADEPGGTT